MTILRLGPLVPVLAPGAWVHPSAHVIGDVVLGEDVSIWPGAILRADHGRIVVGAGSNVQDGCVLHTQGAAPTTIGRDCVIGHLVHLESCTLEDAVLVGSTSAVLPGAVVRTGAMVAAGAVVTPRSEVPPGMRAQGVPARLVPAGDAIEAEVRALAARYRHTAARHRDDSAVVPAVNLDSVSRLD
jgi:carbonic anhydrase/acetyltransferase-like protein (isoleucine patch superfamily)